MITPLHDFVLLIPRGEYKDKDGKNEFGLILPDHIDQESNLAEVVTMGEGCKLKLKEKDVVIVRKYKFDEFEVDKKKYFIGPEEGIIALYDSRT